MRFPLAFFIFLPLLLSSCSISEEGLDLGQTSIDTCEESGGEFCDIESGNTPNLELVVTSANPVLAKTTARNCTENIRDFSNPGNPLVPAADQPGQGPFNYCFDVEGVCRAEGVDTSVIIITNGLTGTTQSLPGCQRGRFSFQFRVPFTAGSQFCKSHDLTIELIGKKIDGSEQRNELQAKKIISYSVPSHPACP